MYGYPTVTRRGPRSLHFRGRRPLPRLTELAHAAACGLPPLSATAEVRGSSFRRRERLSLLGHVRLPLPSTYIRT